tara:strand:+ start:67 stop:408 length:342 start_codon:yes stop_codon:yes gene_type:complete
MTDFGLILTYIMVATALLACLASPIIQLIKKPKKISSIIKPMFLILLILVISMAVSSDEVLSIYTDSNGNLISKGLSKFVGSSLFVFYILSLIAISTVIYSEFISKIFKNGKK